MPLDARLPSGLACHEVIEDPNALAAIERMAGLADPEPGDDDELVVHDLAALLAPHLTAQELALFHVRFVVLPALGTPYSHRRAATLLGWKHHGHASVVWKRIRERVSKLRARGLLTPAA